MSVTIVIDPGHGGVDANGEYQTPGKRYVFDDGKIIYEGQRMRVLASFLAAELTRLCVPCRSSLTGNTVALGWRPQTADVSLKHRVRSANAIDGVTLFVSLHSNAISSSSVGEGQTKASGISIYTSVGRTESDLAASYIWKSLKATNLLKMRSQSYQDGDPDYEAGFYVLKNTRGYAVLIELGFHDNPSDADWLLDDDNLLKAAIAIAAGITTWVS